MRVLHITDFHFKSPSYFKFDQENVIENIISKIKFQKIDLVFFTGDLVHNGSNLQDFIEASNSFLTKVKKAIDIHQSQIFICPGNHDVDRTQVLPSLNTHFESKILNDEDLNNFIYLKGDDYLNSLKPTNNYREFSIKLYQDKNDNVEDLYTTHVRIVDGKKVGIVTLNSAWRSYSDDDEGNLLFPTNLLKEAINEIKETHCKILLLHHPLHWFKGFNYNSLQNIIHTHFNMMFLGHLHEDQVSSHYLANNGILSHISPASLTYENDKSLGYSIIEYDFNNEEDIRIERFTFSRKELIYTEHEPIIIKLPSGIRKEKQNQIRKKITGKYSIELSNSNDLLLENVDDEEQDKFVELFSHPVLRKKSKAELTSEDSLHSFNYLDLLKNDDNFLILGNDKSGKTSLLKSIQLFHLKNYSKNGNIPFYLDFSKFEGNSDKNFDLVKVIRNYFEVNYTDTISLIKDHKFRLLIDNYDPKNPLNDKIIKFLNEFEEVNYVVVSSQTASSTIDLQDFGSREYIKLFIHDLSRKEIRTFTNKWNIIRNSEKDKVIEKIIDLCKQLEIPANYWTVSLFLLVHNKMNNDTSKNLFEVLDLCVDEILNKKFLTLSRSRLKFEQLKKICSELAHFLLINHRKTLYSTNYVNLLTFINDYIKENPRISADSKEILDYLIESGILKLKEDNTYTFRLNGIFEYFLAYYLTIHEEFKNTIIANDEIYLSFKNELEIYSGFKNDDKDFLNSIYLKTKAFFAELNNNYDDLGKVDDILSLKSREVSELSDLAKKIKSIGPLDKVRQDELIEELQPLHGRNEIKQKELFNTKQINSDILERYLSILARVYKNADEVKDIKLTTEIFDFLINTYINFGFYLLDELEDSNKAFLEKNNITDKEINLLKLLSSIIPIVTGVVMYDGVGHYNIEKIIEQKINDLTLDAKNNQYKLFLLYLLLVDIDFEKNYSKLDNLSKIIEKGILKSSLVIKLSYYLAFKAYNNPRIEDFLRKKIQSAQLKLNNRSDIGHIHKDLENKSKKNIIKRKLN